MPADLSVILPTYNHAHFLPRALGALLQQRPAPREILVVDDGSTDDTASVVERFVRQSPCVRLVRHATNAGCVARTNEGLRQVTGKYVYLTASDDYVLPGFIAQLTEQLEQHPQADLACAFHSTVDEDTGKVRLNPSGWSAAASYLPPDAFVRRVGRSSVPGHSAIWRREALLAIGGYLPDLEWLTDWFAGLVLAFRTGLCHVPAPLALLTVRRASFSASAVRDSSRVRQVLGALLDRLRSAAFADVAGSFAASGVMTPLGPELVRAAAARADRWDPEVLALIAGLAWEEYEGLLEDDDAEVRRLAAVLLGPRWLHARHARSHRRARLLASVKGRVIEWLSRQNWRWWLQARRGQKQADRLLRRSA